MSIAKSNFLVVLLSMSVLLFTSCDTSGPKAKKKSKSADAEHAAVDEPPEPASKPDPNDPLSAEPALPRGPSAKESDSDSKVKFDPIKIKNPKVKFEEPAPPKIDEPGTSQEHVLQPLPIPKAGVAEPTYKPEIVTLTFVGGPGKQWIQDVGFTEDGRIYAKSGGGTFTIYYSPDGKKKLAVEGDLGKSCVGPRGPSLGIRGGSSYRASCPTSKVKLEIGSEAFGAKAQPYLKSSYDWKWWGWQPGDMGKGMEASARGIRVHYLHDDRFLARVLVDGGNTTVAKSPKNLKDPNPALGLAALQNPGGPGTLYMVGNGKTGTVVGGTFVKGKALAEVADGWERLYVGLPWGGTSVADTFKIGGTGGFCILNANLTTPLFSTTLGADNIYAMALKDNILVLGGNIGEPVDPDPKNPPKTIPPAKLPIKNPAQELPGGDEDGFLAIIKLW
jgi:hypothetical protein